MFSKATFSLLTVLVLGSLTAQEAKAQQVSRRHSLLITAWPVLESVGGRTGARGGSYDMGRLLAEVGEQRQALVGKGDRPFGEGNRRTAGAFVENIFAQGNHEQGLHADAAARATAVDTYPIEREHFRYHETRIGLPTPESRRLGVIFEHWMPRASLRALDLTALPWDCQVAAPTAHDCGALEAERDLELQAFEQGPFRLLAVVNRMDLAGEHDDRINSGATATPRTFGELHLVYGVVHPEWESQDGEAFPMTFELNYRIPAWNPLPSTMTGYPQWDPFVGDEEAVDRWRNEMRSWANAWANLSNFDLGTPEYEAELEALLERIVKPENFVSLRNNTRVIDTPVVEHELREWYVLQNNRTNKEQMLVPRKPRREPYACLNNSDMLIDTIEATWDSARGDFQMFAEPDVARGGLGDHLRVGYGVLRDNDRSTFAGMPVTEMDAYLRGDDSLRWNSTASACYSSGQDADPTTFTVPFHHLELPENGEPSTLMLAPFARTKPATPKWGMSRLWNVAGNTPALAEKKRHAFAMRTCSGCHSAEGASEGFHIEPRQKYKQSRLSGFLSGEHGLHGYPNTYTVSDPDVTYTYDRLGTRRQLLMGYRNRSVDLYEGLYLPELVED